MWPNCINNLSPVKNSLGKELPQWVTQAFNQREIFNKDEMFVPLQPISVLGQCATMAYIDCPNIPEHHVYHAQNGLDIGKYYWFDFNIVGSDDETMQLRMVVNVGDADCNDGLWGAVWERNTKELVANIISSGDMETTIEAISQKYIIRYKPHNNIWIPTIFSRIHAKNLQLEELIDLAIQICFYPKAKITDTGVCLSG